MRWRSKMKLYSLTIDRSTGHTFRRRFPVWVGMVFHNDSAGRRWTGMYVRVADRGYFAQSAKPFKRTERRWLNRLARRVTVLEKAMDQAGIDRNIDV
jgi:hypothetical protein